MKKNFLVTTSLIDGWEFNERNFLLGRWCEFYEFDDFTKEKFKKNISEADAIIKFPYHWANLEKKSKDYGYIKEKLKYLLEIISKTLSKIHNVDENREYWRVIVYGWLCLYVTTIFDRWENIRIFFERNKNQNFFSNFIDFDDSDYIPKDYINFINNSQKDEWNHLVFLRIFNFLDIQNLSLIKKKSKTNDIKKKFDYSDVKPIVNLSQGLPLLNRFSSLIDNTVSKIALRFNKIIIESFYFPRKEYLKICLRCKIIPSKYSNIFDFTINQNNSLENNKRSEMKNLLSQFDSEDKFIKFLLQNLYKDIPRSYLENFNEIKKNFSSFTKKKKTIFSMHSMLRNDNFRIFLAESKKFGSKYFHSVHGGGLSLKIPPYYFEFPAYFDYFEKISEEIITWSNTEQSENIYNTLSPTLPIINLKKNKEGSNCSIIFAEPPRYRMSFAAGPDLDQSIEYFNELIKFVNNLNSDIKTKIKFRTKGSFSYDSKKKFAEKFGEQKIENVSFKNPFIKTIFNSKLIIITYPQTVFSEAMYSDVPTILIVKKNHWQFSETASKIFDLLKENKIAFENFNDANIHINKFWNNIDLWWKSKNVQSARKKFLENFFNVKSDWYKEWSDYIFQTSHKK